MPKLKRTHDVFLSYPVDLVSQAKVVKKKFDDAGLVVFAPSEVEPGYNIVEETWQSLAESWAVVVLIKPGSMPPSVAVEIGAASAWQKPVYILTEGKGEYHFPLNISKYEVFKTSEISKVIELISKDLNPLSEEQREALVEAYIRLRIPTDRLFREPASLEQFRSILWREFGVKISGERIMQELLRLRKSGKLTRIRRKK